jgi:hypothetical protein
VQFSSGVRRKLVLKIVRISELQEVFFFFAASFYVIFN